MEFFLFCFHLLVFLKFSACSGQSGTLTCGKPVLRSLVPLYCPAHVQKQPVRGVRKANNNVATATAKISRPKLHLVIAEYVRLIQSKRRAARESAMKPVSGSLSSVKDGSSGTAPPSCVKLDQTVCLTNFLKGSTRGIG